MSPCSGSSAPVGVDRGFTSGWWGGSSCGAEAVDDQPETGHSFPVIQCYKQLSMINVSL